MAEQETDAPLVIDPNALDLEVAQSIVEESLPDEAEANELFLSGDHWQDGTGWIGPVPPTEDTDREDTLALIRTSFTSRNVLREIVMRRVRGVIGKEPRFGVVPRAVTTETELAEAQKKAKLEIEAALTEWWDRRKAHKALERATIRACWATRGPLRVYIPAALVPDGETVPRQPDLASALRFIHVESLNPFSATVASDIDTGDEVGILLTANEEGDEISELVFLGEAKPGADVAERPTVFRTITEDTDVPDDEDAPSERDGDVTMQLGGRITMALIESDLLISTQLQQMQRALNLCLTMIPHNIVTGGFLERIILNGLPPGHWEKDAHGRKTKFIREPFETGPSVTSWVSGIEIPNKDGSVSVTSPSVSWRPPTDPEFASKAKRSIYQDMLEEADQAHVLISGDAMASAVARVQARADFDMSLTQLEGPVNSVGRWLVEVVLALAESLMQQPGAILNEWRGQFECRVTSAPLTNEERVQNVNELTSGILSRETVQERNGVADVAAENARIAADPSNQTRDLRARADITLALTNAGADIVAAATVAGIESAESLAPTDVPEPGDDDEDDDLPTGGRDDVEEEGDPAQGGNEGSGQ